MSSGGPSSALCRVKEAQQSALAESTKVPQVRTAALLAAAAWNEQAVVARAREVQGRARANQARLAQAIKILE